MKNLLISLLISAGVVAPSFAGDAEAGKNKAAICAACHGGDGNSAAPAFPKIAGQGERYLIKQITDIKSGARNVPEMTAFVAALTEQDIADISAFYASQTPTSGAADPELVELGQRIYRAGNEKTGVPACMACHGPAGKGIDGAAYPLLAGQHAAYTEKQLKNFYHGTRTNDGDSKPMRSIAERMHEKEIKAVSSYIQGLR